MIAMGTQNRSRATADLGRGEATCATAVADAIGTRTGGRLDPSPPGEPARMLRWEMASLSRREVSNVHSSSPVNAHREVAR